MRRLVLTLLVAIVAGALLSLAISYDTGYVRLSFGHWLVETNLWVGLALFIVAAWALHLLILFLTHVRLSPRAVKQWADRNARRRARKRTTQGLLQLAEGNWGRARKLLTNAADHADTPLINYLAAAEAAHALGDYDEAEELLRKAYESTPGSDLAVGLSQAKLQLAAGRHEKALATLLRLRRKAPNHPFVLRQLKNAYEALGEWRELAELLPDMRKHGAMDDSDLDALEQRVWIDMLEKAAEQVERQPAERRNLNHLDRVWDELPPSLRNDHTVVHAYASHLANMGEEGRAESLLRKVLSKHWSDSLINLYGRLAGKSPDEQLLSAERWLKQRPNSAELMLALGRLSLRNQLWGKAREYFEASLKLQRNSETIAELCRLYAHMGHYEQSVNLLKQGVLEQSGLPELPMPRPRLAR